MNWDWDAFLNVNGSGIRIHKSIGSIQSSIQGPILRHLLIVLVLVLVLVTCTTSTSTIYKWRRIGPSPGADLCRQFKVIYMLLYYIILVSAWYKSISINAPEMKIYVKSVNGRLWIVKFTLTDASISLKFLGSSSNKI